MENPMTSRSFEELAQEWAPRARRFLSLVASQFMFRVRSRLPAFITGAAFFLIALFCAAGVGAWISIALWHVLQFWGMTAAGAAGVLAAAFALLGVVAYFIGRSRAKAPPGPPTGILRQDNREIDEAGRELVTLFKDLTIAAKHSLSPNEIIKPYAVKVAVTSTALGFLMALNYHPRTPTKGKIG
jgi:hypothetical protein